MNPSDIKGYRKRKDLTQEDLGKLCGVGKSSVSQWESGATEPSGAARVILEELLSGERALIPLTPLEEKLLDELVTRKGCKNREELLKLLVLDAIGSDETSGKKKR